MATSLTVSTSEDITLTITDGSSTVVTPSTPDTTLTINTALSAAVASDIVYTPSGKMSSTNMQNAIDELAGDAFVSASAPSGSQLGNGDLWYDSDDHELKVYRDSNWQTIAAAGGPTETMLTMDGGSF